MKHSNRLKDEQSPYLLQHADNPKPLVAHHYDLIQRFFRFSVEQRFYNVAPQDNFGLAILYFGVGEIAAIFDLQTFYGKKVFIDTGNTDVGICFFIAIFLAPLVLLGRAVLCARSAPNSDYSLLWVFRGYFRHELICYKVLRAGRQPRHRRAMRKEREVENGMQKQSGQYTPGAIAEVPEQQ